ncbi:MAG: hypothetical protein D6770_03480 [Anaerolineae bacterium]|nr:MAG: hypothetical protein D6770_03480 [Anaerolineae bacterium]
MNALKKFSQFFGLHPLVGFGMFAVDIMLFGLETSTLEVGWLISVPIAAALAIPSALIQKYSFNDNWGTAIGKGMLIGVLTAIPTPLPSVVPFIGGVLGAVKMLGAGEARESHEER